MKTTIKCVLGLSMLASAGMAQTQYDVVRNAMGELNGTARFVGMGGAMSALGADLSVMGTNPAGIGLYRSNDFSLSFGFNKNQTTGDLGGSVMKNGRARASFDQVGIVYTGKIGNKTNLRFFNVGFNYHKLANFNRQVSSGGNLNGASLTWQMADMLLGGSFDNGRFYVSQSDMDALFRANNPYTDPKYYGTPYLSAMGVRGGLVRNPYDDSSKRLEDIADFAIAGWNASDGEYFSREEGGIDAYDFTLAANVKDRFYFGATVGVYDINYSKYSSYSENLLGEYGEGIGGFTLENWFNTEGIGFDFKVGAIVRPFEYSPFRIGFAVHTPIWYSLTDRYVSSMGSNVLYQDAGQHIVEVNNREDLAAYLPDYYLLDYQLTTPWKINLSMGTTVSDVLALGAEYEFAKYSSSKCKDADGYDLTSATEAAGKYLKASHTVRLGMEAKLSPAFSFRAGYNFMTSPIKKESVRYVPNIDSAMGDYIWFDETRTDPEYYNLKARNTLTLGLGYRGDVFYADIAYKYDFYKADFYLFDDYRFSEDGQWITGRNVPAKVDNDRHQLLFTFGVRF